MLAWTDHLPEILNERIQIFHEDRYRDIVKHVKASGGLLSECSVMDPERRRLKLKHAWHWFVLSTDDGRPLTGGANLIWTVVDYSET